MNKIYKLVWSTRARQFVVASEAATSRGRASSEVNGTTALAVGLAGALLSSASWATPCGNTDISVSTSSTVQATCQNQSFTVSATLDVPGDTGLTNYDGATYFDLGAITISATGRVEGQRALVLSSATITGDITNDGTIDSYWSGGGAGFGGPGIAMIGMTIDGTISNTGTIHGGDSGISAESTQAVLLKNSGTISSEGMGITVFNTSSISEIRNEATGLIEGSNQGIDIHNTASVGLLDNSGTISSGGNAVRVYDTGANLDQIVNREGALIEGNMGIYIDAYGTLGDVENYGEIHGTQSGIETFYSTISGTIENKSTGLIYGDRGIKLMLESQVNAIINEGRILGSTVGIDGHEGSVIFNGISNSGTIHGGISGVQLIESSTISGGIVNSGVIEGGDYAIYVDTGSGASLDQLDLTGTHAQLIGDVDASTTDVNVKSGAAFTTTNAFNVNKFTVESGATLTLTSALHTGSGLSTNGITVAQGFFNNGAVVVGSSTFGRVNGNYTQSAGASLSVGVDGLNNHGVLSVSGNATLANGSTLKVDVGGNASFNAGDRVTAVVMAGGTLTVDTANGLTVQDNSVLYKFTASTSRAANELDLIVEQDQSPFSNNVGSGRTPLGGVAANLDKILANGVPSGLQPVMDRLSALPANELPAVMSQLVPVMTGAGSQAGVNALRSMNKIIQSRVESNQGLSAGNPASERYLWVRAFGSSGDQASQDVVAGFRSQTSGLVLGGDKPINDKLRAGFAFTFARTDIDSRGSAAPSSLDVSTYELVHYGSYNLDPVTDINYQLDVGYNDVKGVRQILFMGQQAQSDFNSLNLHGSVGIGRTWNVAPQSSVTPSVRVDYTHMRTGSYTETGADALNLQVDGSTFKEFMLTADLKGAHNLAEHTKLVGNVSAGYDFLNKQSVTTSAFVGGGSVFETKGLDSSPWVYRGGVGLMHDTDNMEYSLRYDLERRTSGYTNQTLSARARWAF